ncbi:hypothetical protein DUI87_28846 [Hirundo rustica rustica]|uniref:Uncharacterized protein n=1 Tax=Hirundo rustica rustica TaxID=333673 RepID=A0A3M0J769_HIRRU|nr:hypothetical protein DUI87_28846 [Hirundo rustica rustica]
MGKRMERQRISPAETESALKFMTRHYLLAVPTGILEVTSNIKSPKVTATYPWKVVVRKYITCGSERHDLTSPTPQDLGPVAAKQPHLQQSKSSTVLWRKGHARDVTLSCVLLVFGQQECLRSCWY